MYDESSKAVFSSKTESVQYNAELEIIGAIRGFSHEKLYQELGIEDLHHRR